MLQQVNCRVVGKVKWHIKKDAPRDINMGGPREIMRASRIF